LPSLWFSLWGELVIYLVYFYLFVFLLHFLQIHLSHFASPVISLYFLNYAYHCARMSSNEIWTFFLDHAK
jgi:hypothetical protein